MCTSRRVDLAGPENMRGVEHAIRHVFIMTGASPRTEWLRGCLALDDKGFILTGRDLDGTSPGIKARDGRSAGLLRCSRPACRACSRSATCGPGM